MKNRRFFNSFLVFVFLLFCQVQPLFAGPGGKIAKELFDSPLGKVVGLILGIIFLPFIIYQSTREYFGIRKTKKDLEKLTAKNSNFEWFNLKNRVTEVFGNVHRAWSVEDVSIAADWMTSWYWQNQQLVYLDKWKSQGLVNHCDVRRVLKIEPLMVKATNQNNFEGSRLVMSITANMEDYLAERESEKVIEGKKGYKNVTTVWTFLLENNLWKVENIEQTEKVMDYAKMKNVVPVHSVGHEIPNG